MTIGVLSEYLKTIAQGTVNKMEKKQKIIKAIICILTALLIAGCFIVMAFMPKIFEAKTASAETDTPTTNNSIPFESIEIEGDIQTTTTDPLLYFETQSSKGIYKVDLILPKSVQSQDCIIDFTYSAAYPGSPHVQCNLLTDNVNKRRINLPIGEYKVYQFLGKNAPPFEFNKLRIWLNYGQNTGQTNYICFFKLTIRESRKTIVKYDSWLNSIFHDRYENGYDIGYEIGYGIGHNAGYQVGYDQGIVGKWQSPIEIFIKPVDIFLSTNIFGNISIGDILSIILFVMVGIIFIKMFAGG